MAGTRRPKRGFQSSSRGLNLGPVNEQYWGTMPVYVGAKQKMDMYREKAKHGGLTTASRLKNGIERLPSGIKRLYRTSRIPFSRLTSELSSHHRCLAELRKLHDKDNRTLKEKSVEIQGLCQEVGSLACAVEELRGLVESLRVRHTPGPPAMLCASKLKPECAQGEKEEEAAAVDAHNPVAESDQSDGAQTAWGRSSRDLEHSHDSVQSCNSGAISWRSGARANRCGRRGAPA
ncbi:hypothetical protein B0H14DRAFT_828967 [Mycena olivaceomarginata]|nr:hypothetical protein B0H14DRAFT_828967 [Mycena olivaceomarginata]